MKICLLSYRGNPYCGGQGIYLKYTAEELINQGHDVHIIVGSPFPEDIKGANIYKIYNQHYSEKKDKSIIDEKSNYNIFSPINFYQYLFTRVGTFSEISSFTFRAYLLLRKLVRLHSFDIIHDNQSLGYGLLLIKTLGVPVISTIHHPLTIDLENVVRYERGFIRKARFVLFYPILMQKIVSKRLDHIITVSENSKESVRKFFGVPLEKQTVVYNGINRKIFHPIKKWKKKEKKIIFVGNVEDEKKGFMYLLMALKIIDKEIQLIVVDGGSPHRKKINRFLENYNFENRITFTGKISTDELVRLYSEASIAVVPSLYEGFGFPAAEAMACGIPVISSNGGALPEVVGDAGIIVPACNEIALADAIENLISDKGNLKRLSKEGVERVKNVFSWETAVNEMVNIYGRTIKKFNPSKIIE